MSKLPSENQLSKTDSVPFRSVPFRFVLCFALLVGASVSGYFAFSDCAPENKSTVLIADKSFHHFGKVGQGEAIQTQFVLTNNHPFAIEFGKTLTGCSCEAVRLSKIHLKPGESSTLMIQWSIGQRRGLIADRFWAVYNRPDSQDITRLPFDIAAEVEPDLQVEPDPDSLEFEVGRAETKSFAVKPGRVPDFQLQDAYCNSPLFKVEFDKTSKRIKLSYSGQGLAEANSRTVLTVVTDAPHETRLAWPIRMIGAEVPQSMPLDK